MYLEDNLKIIKLNQNQNSRIDFARNFVTITVIWTHQF